jgi:hypothetical protein
MLCVDDSLRKAQEQMEKESSKRLKLQDRCRHHSQTSLDIIYHHHTVTISSPYHHYVGTTSSLYMHYTVALPALSTIGNRSILPFARTLRGIQTHPLSLWLGWR